MELGAGKSMEQEIFGARSGVVSVLVIDEEHLKQGTAGKKRSWLGGENSPGDESDRSEGTVRR